MSDATDEMPHTVTARGFKHMEMVAGDYGGGVKVYESSAAEAPFVWLQAVDGEGNEAIVHLSEGTAELLARQIEWLVAHHYQQDGES